jgi:hypothetical protein
LSKTRFRNQADFYSLFVAIDEALQNGQVDCGSEELAERLAEFIANVEDEDARAKSKVGTAYFKATRSNSNDTGPRKARHEILRKLLGNSLDDYGVEITQQIQIG